MAFQRLFNQIADVQLPSTEPLVISPEFVRRSEVRVFESVTGRLWGRGGGELIECVFFSEECGHVEGLHRLCFCPFQFFVCAFLCHSLPLSVIRPAYQGLVPKSLLLDRMLEPRGLRVGELAAEDVPRD